MFTKEELIDHLEKNTKVLQNQILKDTFVTIDRNDFVPEDYKEEAYEDYSLPLGDPGSTISQPTTVAFMLELLDPQEGDRVLDIGSGSGWTTALLAHIVGERGEVIGLEKTPSIVKYGQENIKKYNFAHAEIREAGDKLGLPEEASFDRILVSAAAEELPQELLEQLNIGGVLVVPVYDNIWRVKKTETGTDIKKYDRFEFVPLVV